MTRIITSLAAFFCLLSSLNSQAIFLKFDENCMNRLEYTGEDSATPYVSYSAKQGDKKFLLFDVGKENTKWDKDLPGKLTYCNAMKMDNELVRQVNTGSVKMYIVRESPTHYNVSMVDKASYFEEYGSAVDFVTEDADFVLYKDNLVSEVNLAKPSSRMQVYLDGTLKVSCLTGYILTKREFSGSAAFKEYVFIPGIGIAEKNSVTAGGRAISLKLNRIAGKSYQQVLNETCDQIQASYYDEAITSSGVPESYGDFTSRGQETPKSYDGDPCAPSQTAGIHTVQKGETLYSISRRYGVTVDQINTWNKLANSSILSICQQLYVKEPSSGSGTATGSSTSSTTTGKGGGDYTGQAYWINAPQVHTVKPGETVSGLAKLFGYTEERFRKMNSLGASEQIYPGQKLRTTDCVCPTLESTTKDQPLPYDAESGVMTAKTGADVYFRPIKVHQVQKSETLFSIAKLYNTTVDRILELNGMKKGDSLQPNQRIYVQ
jgi:LysM repeat protein